MTPELTPLDWSMIIAWTAFCGLAVGMVLGDQLREEKWEVASIPLRVALTCTLFISFAWVAEKLAGLL